MLFRDRDETIYHIIVTVQLSSPKTGVIPLPFGRSFDWSDISSDDTTDS